MSLLISAPRGAYHFFLSLTLSVCPHMSIRLSRSFKLILLVLFLDGIEPFFSRQFSMPPQNVVRRFLIQAP